MNRVIALVAALVAGLAFGQPAHAAGPSHAQPSELPLTQARAHHFAARGQAVFLAAILPVGAKFHVGRCTDGPMVWHCPMQIHASDTDCTADVLVWKDAQGGIYFEDDRLRCD
jgi:hypothetical protein